MISSFRLKKLSWLGLLLAGTLSCTRSPQAQEPNAQAASAPAPVRIQKDIVYGEAGGQKLLLDLYTPTAQAAAGAQRPAMILVHGGGWSAGDKGGSAAIGDFLTRQGFVAFSINYRLVTDTANKFPAQLDDAQRAVRWVRAHAPEYGINPKKLGALGDSAGGHLVALLGTMETRDNSDKELAAYSSRVACVVDLYGPADLTQLSPSPEAESIVLRFLGQKPQDAPALYRAASPKFHIDKKTAPFLIFHGTADPLVPLGQSRILHKALQDAGIESTLIEFEGEGHGFRKKENIDTLANSTLAFLKKHLGPVQP